MPITTNNNLLKKARDLIRLRGSSMSNDVADYIQLVVPMNDDSDANYAFKTGQYLASPAKYQQVFGDTLNQTCQSGVDYTLHTLTAGKVYYLSHISIWSNVAVGETLTIYNGAGGAQLYQFASGISTNPSLLVNFPVPIPVTANMVIRVGTAGLHAVVISSVGWEEDVATIAGV